MGSVEIYPQLAATKDVINEAFNVGLYTEAALIALRYRFIAL